jgi:DNA-binding transcriptional LysR family regulator
MTPSTRSNKYVVMHHRPAGRFFRHAGMLKLRLRLRVDGQLVFGRTALILEAAVAGFGLAYLPEQQMRK